MEPRIAMRPFDLDAQRSDPEPFGATPRREISTTDRPSCSCFRRRDQGT